MTYVYLDEWEKKIIKSNDEIATNDILMLFQKKWDSSIEIHTPFCVKDSVWHTYIT